MEMRNAGHGIEALILTKRELKRNPVPTAQLVHPGMEQGDDGQPPPATFRLELEHPL
jgi:hypothetical protein